MIWAWHVGTIGVAPDGKSTREKRGEGGGGEERGRGLR